MRKKIEIENRIIHLNNLINEAWKEALDSLDEARIITLYKQEIVTLKWVLNV